MITVDGQDYLDILDVPWSDKIQFPVINTGVPQVIYDQFQNPRMSPMNRLQFVYPHQNAPGFERVHFPLLDYLDRFSTIIVLRTYALGDVMTIIPFLKMLKRKYPDKTIGIASQTKWLEVFKYNSDLQQFPAVKDAFDRFSPSSETVIDLDNCTFETDHSNTHPFRHFHRLDILYYLFRVAPEDRSYDFSLPLATDHVQAARYKLEDLGLSPQSYVCFAWRSTQAIRTLNLEARKAAVREVAKHIPVLIFDDGNSPEGRFESENVFWWTNTPLLESICCVGMSKCVITVDSGLLWMSHATRVPCVAYLGPTREQEKLIHHPCYPDQCASVDLRVHVGCPEVCYGQGYWCGARKCATDVQPELLATQTIEALKKINVI